MMKVMMMMMMVIVLYQEGDDCHSGIHQKEFREMEFILSCLGEWARNFPREHDLRKNWKLPFFICVVSNFQPKMVFFMKSFIASLFYVFLASISLFFSFLIFSNSFSFRFRNNTACTPDFFALKFIPPGRAYLMFHFWCCGRERGLGDILSWGKEIFEMCMGGELVLHANMIIKIMYLFVLW